MHQIIVRVTDMVSWDSEASKLAKRAGLSVNMVSWEDCARNKGSCWGPCISDMTLRVNGSCMPVIRRPNYSDTTWDVKMQHIPIVVGNHSANEAERLQTISLSDYLSNFGDFMTNDQLKGRAKGINLLSPKENADSHVIMSSQCCFLPIVQGEETKFNVALFNYQSRPKNPAVLVIVSTSKGASAQIIEGREQHLLFNKNGKKADFVGERVSDVRRKKGLQNVNDKKLSKQEKQDNVIVVVQVPLKQKKVERKRPMSYGFYGGSGPVLKSSAKRKMKRAKGRGRGSPNVEAAMVSVAERTKPICKCNGEMERYQLQFAYNGTAPSIECDECSKTVSGKEDVVYHCPNGKNSWQHRNGYDLCIECGDKQLRFDELRGLLKSDKEYALERNEQFPVRVTLQYYKATDNGAVDKEIMDDIVKQLESSQKQADFMGSLVTEYDPNRPSEWVANPMGDEKVDDGDENRRIRMALEKHCGSDWKDFLKNFENEQVLDADLENLSADDLKSLIPKIGPRNRFKKWMEEK